MDKQDDRLETAVEGERNLERRDFFKAAGTVAGVAAAAGGFLGLSTISKHEQAKIDEIAKAWEG